MVFESLVVDLMNKYLGKYIENLDSSQLKLGIWGGDAVLQNLHVKGDALKDLNLPVEIKSGHIGKLTLKIPWKNLYKEAVEATLDGLFLLAVPNVSMEYDPEKEAKKEQDNKQAQISAIEAQQLAKKKGKEEKQDGFVEKLATQIIKNLQIRISNIHIRYEDKVTMKQQPFALGITLDRLNFETTNENWMPCLLDESVKIIFKMVDLQCLSVYWNSEPKTFISDSSRDKQLNIFRSTIASQSFVPPNFTYIIKPITLQAKLRLNPHPESDLATPKIVLTLLLQEVGLRLLHQQYHSIMELVESMDRMVVNAPFRKFKPNVRLSGNTSLWWKYAFNSVTSIGIISNAKNWSWSHIREHRKKIREYKALYKEKLQEKKPSQSLTDKLIAMENGLDIFNITLARQTAELELTKAGRQIRSKKSVHQPDDEKSKEGGGWFSGWFGKKKKPDEEKEVAEQGLDSVMSSEEKDNLYLAIGYSEGEVIDNSAFPKSYIGTKLNIDLQKVSVELSDSSVSDKDLLSLRLLDVHTVLDQRPSAQGLGVTAHMSSFEVDGIAQGDFVPCLISSQLVPSTDQGTAKHLLSVLFEKRPLDETCDQRILVDSQPLQIVYDAATINHLMEFFKPPRDMQLQQLRSVAASAYDDIKEQTATGLQHVMETRNVVEIGIFFSSSYVVVPSNGCFQNEVDALVLDLGEISFQSSNHDRTPLMKRTDDTLDLQEMRSKAYENYKIEVRKIQLLFARRGEDWMSARKLNKSKLHILTPLDISVLLQKCMVTNDAALPKIKISGEIPLLGLRISDVKLQEMLKLIKSIPLPEPITPNDQAAMMALDAWTKDTRNKDLKVLNSALTGQFKGSMSSVSSGLTSSADDEFFTAESDFGSDMDDDKAAKRKRLVRSSSKEKQMTDLSLNFSINEMVLRVTEELNKDSGVDLVLLNVGTLAVDLNVRTWDTSVGVSLDFVAISLLQFKEPDGSPLYLINSAATGGSKHLLNVNILQVQRRSPDFVDLHNRTELKVLISFGILKVGLHAQAMLELASFAKKLAVLQTEKPEKPAITSEDSFKTAHSVHSPKVQSTVAVKTTTATTESKPTSASAGKNEGPPVINVHLEAKLECINVTVMDQTQLITKLKIEGVETMVLMTLASQKVLAKLHNFEVCDTSAETLYTTIVSAVGQDVLQAEFINYIDATKAPGALADMDVVDTSVHLKLGCLRVVFLNKFVQKLIAYGAYFKDAKQAAIDAGTAAQQQASAKARELASSNPRIKLDVTVYAPKVVVPMHSMSRDAITADLGTLTVTNRFLASDQQHENSPAVRDEMMVKLQDMKLQTCKIGENMKSTDEAPIMEDLILVIEIVRNLSVSWYNDVPDVSISGHMPPILLKLSQQDMISVMTMLDKNLKEGKIDEIESVVEATVQATVAPAYGTAVEKEPAIPAKAEIEKVWETLKVSFGLESVILQLYSDAQRKEPLSKLEFARIKADVVMRSDKLVNVEVSLGELALHDTRKGHAGGITRFIQNRTQENGTNVVQAKIVQLSDGSLEVEAMVRSLNIIICMEFIMGLANFFMKSLPEKTSPEPVPKKEIESSVPSKGARVSKVDHPKIPANRAVPDKKSEGSKAIRVTFFLEEPEIVLVTDVRSVESEAIVLGLKLDFKFDVTPDGKQQLMSAALSDLHVVGCSFKNVLNKATPSPFTHKQILAPCDISFAGLVGELEQKFNVTLSDLRLKASPVIIHTISDIVDHLTLPPKKDVEQEEAGKRLSGYQALSIWTSQKVDEMKLWFMKENSSSVDDLEEDFVIVAENKLDGALKMETANLSMPLLQIQLEAGSGHHTIPLLITECTVEGEIKNWSSGEMSGEVELTLGTAYFNDTLSVWEPLIEPVEVDAAAIEPKYEPWKVTTSIQQRKPSKDDSPELAALMTVSVESQNVLQTTITNSAIKVINGLARAFKDAALSRRNENRKKKKKKHAGVEEVDGEVQKRANAAIVVKNHLGFDITVDVGKALTVIEERKKIGNGSSTYSLPNKDHLMLDYCVKEKADLWSVLLDQEKMLTNDSVRITVRLDSSTTASIDISHTGAALHVISTKDGTTLPFVANVMSKPGIRKIELRSHVVFYNHLNVNVEVHSNSDKADIISTIQAKDHLAIPVKTARDHAVKIKPLIEKGNLKSALVSWKNSMDSDKINKFHVQCLPVAGVASPTYISVQVEVEKLIDGAQFDEPGLGIHLRPTAVFQNYLPFPIELEVGGVSVKGHCIDMGQQIQVLDAEMGKSEINIKILSYQNINWISSLTLASNLQELSPWTFNDAKDKNVTITLAKQITYAGGVMTVTLYSPYWMVNKTGFPLDYKSSDDDPSKAVQQAEKDQDVILFSFTSKSFLSKNKLQTRVCNSSFSESFSIDTVGSSGAITCKTKEFNYIIGTNITLTSFSLTKMVTFTSYYSFHNKSGLDVEISESAAQPSNWLSVPSGGKINFWPECKDKFLVVRIKGFDNSVSTKFRYNLLDSGVLVRVGDYALFAEVACTEASIDISIRNYFNGASALLVINDTSSSSVTCWQAKTEAKMQIEAGEAHHVLWDNPTTKREIIWQSSTGKEMTMDVFNEQASFFAVSGQTKIHYVLFVDGLQRTLLFTENEERAQLVEASLRLERANFELNLSLKGISCSLTDSKARREVAYLAIRSSGLVWEEQPRKRWKPLAQKYSQMLEVAYQKQLGGSTHKEHLTLDKYSFDLNTMTVLKPDKCPLQRSFSPGVWFQFTLTPHQMMVHAKINRLQLDSQLPGAVFPVVLNPIPLPKSIAIDSTPKPFIEMSVMQRTSDQQTFTHIKYFRILVQEFSIKLDMGFINALLPVFGAQEVKTTPEQMLQYFQDDLSQTVQTISDEAMENLKAAVNFYDNLHLSPIKVHVSFSMQNTLGDDSQSNGNVVALPFNALSVVLRSVGVTLSDIDDIVFKLAYFERKYQFFTSKEFSKAVTVHYAGQAIKQLYVLVLGLDVIGNPYGLVMGIADGVTSLFYEPYQGMIQGPGEFIQGLGLGALNLFSSTVGGAAGAVSKVTGALGKGIATMTMDDDYKRKRMEQKNKQPANAQEGLARGGKGLVMGVLSGVTGIVTKPIEGAKKEGATGFFKGVGKGLIGVVARPVSGVIDLASSTFEGIQKVADMSEEVRKIRPARWIDSHTGIIQPFSLRRAQGAAILGEVENGRYSKTARYLDHIPLKKDKKSVLLVTNKMVMSVHTGDILGQWKCDWKCNFTDFTEKPQILKDAINFSFKEQPLTWGRVAGDSTQAPQTPAQQIENVFKPLSRAFSFGRQPSGDIASGLKGLFSSGSRKSLFSRSNTIATSSVQYSKGGTNVHLNESTESQPQAKTKSIFGMKNTHHSVIFHDLSYAEYIMKIILARWQRSLKGTSVSSVDSASTSSEER